MLEDQYGPVEQIARRLEREYHKAGGDGTKRCVADALTNSGLVGEIADGSADRLFDDLCNFRGPNRWLWKTAVQSAVFRGDIPPQPFD